MACLRRVGFLRQRLDFSSTVASRSVGRHFCVATPVDPPSTGASAPPKVTQLGDEILKLNMLEVSQLTDYLKTQLGISDIPMMMPSAGVAAAPAAAPAADSEAAAPAEEEKKTFTLKLKDFEAAKKIAVIKEVRALMNLGLKEAKEVVEKKSVLAENLNKEEAEPMLEKLKAAGATVVLE